MAFETKSSFRIPEKLSADEILEAFCIVSVHDECSLMNICTYLYEYYKVNITKPGLLKRVNREGTVELFKEVLKSCLLQSINNKNDFPALRLRFGRVIIQDSTILQLSNRLFEVFFGIKNATSTKTLIRIQFSIDILNNNFIAFSIDSYKENDLASASKIEVIDGDLWLRDRGYFSLEACEKIAREGGDFILRFKAYTTLYLHEKDANGKLIQLDLVKELKKRPTLKIKVYVGRDMVPMLLVVAPASDKIAAERRRKAHLKYRYGSDNNSKSKKVMTPEYRFLCGYTIFLTSVNLNLYFNEVFALYSLRWRIEIIFKAWKSHLNFENIHNVSVNQLYIIIYSKLLVCHLIYSKFYNNFLELVLIASNKIISIIALAKHIMLDFKHNLLSLINGEIKYLTEKFTKFCTYGTRKRKNYFEMEQEIFGVLDSSYAN